jgi:hypothetical protein
VQLDVISVYIDCHVNSVHRKNLTASRRRDPRLELQTKADLYSVHVNFSVALGIHKGSNVVFKVICLELRSQFIAGESNGVLGCISGQSDSIDSLVYIKCIVMHVISILILDIGNLDIIHYADNGVKPGVGSLSKHIQVYRGSQAGGEVYWIFQWNGELLQIKSKC